jgi:hypothetical protein
VCGAVRLQLGVRSIVPWGWEALQLAFRVIDPSTRPYWLPASLPPLLSPTTPVWTSRSERGERQTRNFCSFEHHAVIEPLRGAHRSAVQLQAPQCRAAPEPYTMVGVQEHAARPRPSRAEKRSRAKCHDLRKSVARDLTGGNSPVVRGQPCFWMPGECTLGRWGRSESADMMILR